MVTALETARQEAAYAKQQKRNALRERLIRAGAFEGLSQANADALLKQEISRAGLDWADDTEFGDAIRGEVALMQQEAMARHRMMTEPKTSLYL